MRIKAHPGEILRHEFMIPNQIGVRALARALHVSPSRVNGVLQAEVSVTPDTALRLAQYFGTSPEFWLTLQLAYDLSKTMTERGTFYKRTIEPLRSQNV